MEALSVTPEKKCPKCGSGKVQYQHMSHGVGVGEDKPIPNKHLFKCVVCATDFEYAGPNP
jgi:DNA-directed RNA polymerase subunit RPC12/RpoP